METPQPTSIVFSQEELTGYVNSVSKHIITEFHPAMTYTHTPARQSLCITCKFDGFDYFIYVNTSTKQIDYRVTMYSSLTNIFKVIFNDGNFNQATTTQVVSYFDGNFQELLEWRDTYERITREAEIKKYIKPDGVVAPRATTKMITTTSPLVKSGDLSPYEIKPLGQSDVPFSVDSVTPTMEGFIKFILIIRAYQFNTFIRSIRENKINYDQLSLLYKIKSKYLFPHQGNYEVGVLIQKILQYGIWSFVYQYTDYNPAQKKFYTNTRTYEYANYLQILDIDTVPIKPYTKDLFEEHYQRGQLFIKTAPHIQHMHCNGVFYEQFGSRHLNGRVIIDEGYASKTPIDEPTYEDDDDQGEDDGWGGAGDSSVAKPSDTQLEIICDLADHEIDTCTPFVSCYSLDFEKWGEVLVTNLAPIRYRDDAFEMLCLDTPIKISSKETLRKKDLIHRMVTNYKNVDRSDFIDGKTGGLIISLYGPPGVGKTLTAEATAETLHQPLCKISAGSLGTTPQSVEEALKKFFSDVKRWNGIALIDEVDIFLERRSSVKTDITKNAIVGVFLKIIEYCDAIVFMTSNRIECIDPAMESRIDLKLEYGELSIEDKVKIYINKMKRTGEIESHDEIHRFMEKYRHLNGRNLKSVIKTAQFVAYPLRPTIDHISAVAELTAKTG